MPTHLRDGLQVVDIRPFVFPPREDAGVVLETCDLDLEIGDEVRSFGLEVSQGMDFCLDELDSLVDVFEGRKDGKR